MKPINTVFTDLNNYDFHPEEIGWGEAGILTDLFLGAVSKASDDYAANELVDEYLRGAEEFDIPLPCDFYEDCSKEEAYNAMSADLHNDALDFISEWRENIISCIEQRCTFKKDKDGIATPVWLRKGRLNGRLQ